MKYEYEKIILQKHSCMGGAPPRGGGGWGGGGGGGPHFY
jgi:hypothetical protein